MTLRAIDTRPAPDDEVVKLAEQLLEDARNGTCRGVIVAAAYEAPGEPHCTATLKAGTQDVATMVCALERAKLRLLGVIDEQDLVRIAET